MIARLLNPKGLAIACAVSLALGTVGGWTANGWRLNARIAAIHQQHAEDIAKAVRKARETERQAADASADSDKKAVEVIERIRTETITLTKEVPVYVTPETDVRYALPVGLVRLHDDAASGLSVLPDAASNPDAASGNAEPSAVRPSEFGAVIVGNYGTCRADQARLTELQNWLRKQSDIYGGR